MKTYVVGSPNMFSCIENFWLKNMPYLVHSISLYSALSEGVGVGGGGEGWWGSVETSFDSKFHFHRKFWIKLINLEYRFYPKYSHPFSLSYTSLQQVHFYCL